MRLILLVSLLGATWGIRLNCRAIDVETGEGMQDSMVSAFTGWLFTAVLYYVSPRCIDKDMKRILYISLFQYLKSLHKCNGDFVTSR